MNISLLIIVMLTGMFAIGTFAMACNKRRPVQREFWMVRFKTSHQIEDDITFSIYPDQDPNEEASFAIERYCENTGCQISEITDMRSISHQEYADIRMRLYSKLNDHIK